MKFAKLNSPKNLFPEGIIIKTRRKDAEKYETKIENNIEAVKWTNAAIMLGNKHGCSKLL